ncbi:glycosyltransferase family 4 protein [Streptomyces sp. NPDC050738]|uniref:glycosyltransferase family 4 protein n=1 Tax=Streptomyces sp. NPDC050738 TaxID=3154744 RepID=UPI003430C191
MHIGLAGPVDLAPLAPWLPDRLPAVHSGPSTGWLARTWLEQGHHLTVYALSSEITAPRFYDGEHLRLSLSPQRPRARHRALDLFRAERHALTAAMRAHPADVISAHWTYEFALAAIASGRPALVTARDAPLRCAWEMRSAYRWLRHSMAVPAVHRATAVSANSPYVATHLRRCLALRTPIELIPNAIRSDELPTTTAPPPADTPLFASAAQGWGRLKNTGALLRAFALVRDRLPRARLLLLGDGHGPQGPAHAWAEHRGLTGNVEFAGPLPRTEMLDRLAAEVHVLVHPSRVESFSMICAEAMGIGIPVVAGRSSGAVPWVVGDCGELVDITRPPQIAAAMTALALDPVRRTALGAAGAERVRAHFPLQATAAAYVSWFEAHLPPTA